MVLFARITCIVYLLLLVTGAIIGLLNTGPVGGGALFGVLLGLFLFPLILGGSALLTLGAIHNASPTWIRRASTVNKTYLFFSIAMAVALIIQRSQAPKALTFLPVCILLSIICIINIFGLKRAHARLQVAL